MSRRLATTQWSQVVTARDGAGAEARRALERLCTAYWSPLYSFARHLGWKPEDARDLTQAYFVELLEKDLLADVDVAKGRFRSFLFSSMRHFLAHQRDRAGARKRGGGTLILSLDMVEHEERRASGSAEPLTPAEVFEQRWAMAVIARAMDRLRSESAVSGNLRRFELLKGCLTSLDRRLSYRKVAGLLDMTEGGVKVAVHRLRRRFGRCLRAEIAETVADPADVDEELRHLLSVLRG